MTPRIYDPHPRYAGFPQRWKVMVEVEAAVVVAVGDVVMRTMP